MARQLMLDAHNRATATTPPPDELRRGFARPNHADGKPVALRPLMLVSKTAAADDAKAADAARRADATAALTELSTISKGSAIRSRFLAESLPAIEAQAQDKLTKQFGEDGVTTIMQAIRDYALQQKGALVDREQPDTTARRL